MAVTTRAVGSSSVAAVSLKALLSASDQAATALATAMRTQSFVIIENDVSEHADMSLLYTTIRPEGGGPECSDGARIVAEAEEAALGVLTAQLEGCMDARAGSVHGLRELGYATTTAKRTFNVKQGEGMLKELWPPGQSGDEARTRLNCAFRFLENVCAFSYIVLMSKVREGMSREQALEELKRHGALYDTAAADGPVSASVLQCFWYPNSDGVRENPNCGEHVDQVRETVLLTSVFHLTYYVQSPQHVSPPHTHTLSLSVSLSTRGSSASSLPPPCRVSRCLISHPRAG